MTGVCDSGEFPGHLPAHPREGGPGQAPLGHPPDVTGQGGLVWGGLCTSRLDLLRHGIHQEVPSSTGALVVVVVVVVVPPQCVVSHLHQLRHMLSPIMLLITGAAH